ncbi:MAG: helix-turn-helix domain-containing protein [Rhizobiaceae bacterium]|nr:helix-turn-helix domain-containing protein [Rhizobiaceae bacterium]
MSAFLLGIGFRADMGTCVRKLVLLKLIDACEDDGSRIFPAIATVARAAQCSTRQVQRELKAFLEAGLIRLVREGGKGRRSTNEYALDLDLLQRLGKEGWSAVCGGSAAKGDTDKGDTVSPLEDEVKGDTDDTDRVTPETPKGDKLSHPTPPDSSIDPSRERARERADGNGEDRKKIKADGWALLKNWPQFDGMPKDPALAIWMGLPADERATARRRFLPWLELLRKQGKSRVPAPSTYLREKLWQAVADPADAPPAPLVAAPFGKVWTARWIGLCLAGPGPLPEPRGFVAQLIAQGGELGEREKLAHRMRYGFPAVNRMAEAVTSRRAGCTIGPDEAWLEAASAAFERVHARSDIAAAWEAEFARRGWPWLPDPGGHEWFYFPAGGPDGLGEFEKAMRGGDDGDGQAAA